MNLINEKTGAKHSNAVCCAESNLIRSSTDTSQSVGTQAEASPTQEIRERTGFEDRRIVAETSLINAGISEDRQAKRCSHLSPGAQKPETPPMSFHLNDGTLVTHAFYSPGSRNLCSFLNPKTNRAMFSGETFDEIRRKDPSMQLIPIHEAVEKAETESRRFYMRLPEEITKNRWKSMLNLLPPDNWEESDKGKTFHYREKITSKLSMIFCSIGSRYWEMVDRNTLKHDEIIDLCLERDRRTEAWLKQQGLTKAIDSHPPV